MTKQFLITFSLFFLLSCVYSQKTKLWYNTPANARATDNPNGWTDDIHWLSSLPLGNGSMGVMVFGDVSRERIQLNEETMWSGSPDDNDNPDSYQHIEDIRQLLFEGKYKEATELTDKTQICKGTGSGFGNGANVPFGCFQTMGDLWIDMASKSSYTNYYRELDMETATVRVSYIQDGVRYSREIFTSYPDQVMVARFTADKPGKLSFTCTMNRPERYKTYSENNQLIMSGSLTNGKGGDGLQYMARLKAINKNGKVSYMDSTLVVENADEVILLLSASTDYKLEYPKYSGRDYKNITAKNIETAGTKKYSNLYKAHVNEYKSYFDRVSFSLNTVIADTVPTDRRVKLFKESKNDPYLYQLIFQYGRYLLISSSRPGTMPANLQGIWANKIQTPWNGDYHTDVNIEMNYWPAEVTNLSEMHLPMFDLIASLVEPGKKTANTHYRSSGWVAHPITNVWGYTSPGEGASWGMHTGAAAWICQHIGEHYRFTGDKEFLKRMYPVLKGAVQFYLDWLVKDPKTGKLVSGPAVSPENTFIAPDGSQSQISMGPAHDQQVIWQLFNDFIMASSELGISDSYVENVRTSKDLLAGPQIGSDGRLMEWASEFPEVEPGHRHISHLFALHPGSQINSLQNPELSQAAAKSLDYRLSNGGGHTGWSASWLISQNARLYRSEHAKQNLDVVLSKSTSPNLFGLHPPFQMDANFGTTAAIAEMLLQSHIQNKDGEFIIHLLPALPQSWSNGSVKGLKARGNITVNVKWDNGKLSFVSLVPATNKPFVVRYGDKEIKVTSTAGKEIIIGSDFILK